MAHTSNPRMRQKSPVNRARGHSFLVDFSDGIGRDQVSGTIMDTRLDTGRVNADGTPLGLNVPAIQGGKLNTFGAVGNMLKWSEDISKVEWDLIGLGGTKTATTFKAFAKNAGFNQRITVVIGTLYLISFKAKVEPGGNTDNYAVRHVGAATVATAFSLTENEQLISINVTATATAFYFGFQDINASNWATVHISNFQVTQSSYQLPYVKTEAAAITTPHNYSDDDEGYKWAFSKCPKLFDSLDGAPTGPNLAPLNCCTDPDNDSTSAVGWSSNSGTRLPKPGGRTGNCLRLTQTTTTNVAAYCGIASAEAGDVFEFKVWVRAGTEASYTLYCFANITASGIATTTAQEATSEWSSTTLRFKVPEGPTALAFNFKMIGATLSGLYMDIDDVTIRKVSPAQGTLEVDWTPMFDSAVLPLDSRPNIVQCYSGYPVYAHKDPNGVTSLAVTDATIGASVNTIIVSGTHYKLTAKYGPHPGYANGLKYQLTVTDGTAIWMSSLIDFDGSFNPTTHLTIGWLNTYWQQISSIKVKEANPWIA